MRKKINRTMKNKTLFLIAKMLFMLIIFLFFSPLALADTFDCFDTNVCDKKALSSSTDYLNPRDYETSFLDKGSDVTVLSFHGGCIEPYTSEISVELANQYKWNRYDLKGHIGSTSIPTCYEEGEKGKKQQKKNFKILHITSTNFDDPDALRLVKNYSKSVSLHGYSRERDDTKGYERGTICVGGRNKLQVNNFIEYIKKSELALPYKLIPINARRRDEKCQICNGLQGTNSENIVNKNKSGKGGLQLELSYGMRQDLANLDEAKFNSLRVVIYEAIAEAMTEKTER